MELAAGVPAATTTASALRVRVGRLLDPKRDRSARLARATSLVSVTALALTVAMSTQVAPVVVFLRADAISAPASSRRAGSRSAPRAGAGAACERRRRCGGDRAATAATPHPHAVE